MKKKTEKKEQRIFIAAVGQHRDLSGIIKFCKKEKTVRDDIMIILGDAGINYYGDRRDERLKKKLSGVKVTFLLLQGDKDNPPENIKSYEPVIFNKGLALFQPEYPNILCSFMGEIYILHKMNTLVIGESMNCDTFENTPETEFWGYDGEIGAAAKKRVEDKISRLGGKVDVILSHTLPYSVIPHQMKEDIPPVKNFSTERWLDRIRSKSDFRHWFSGHWPVNKKIGKTEMLYDRIVEFPRK